jgi:hypothetical protein
MLGEGDGTFGDPTNHDGDLNGAYTAAVVDIDLDDRLDALFGGGGNAPWVAVVQNLEPVKPETPNLSVDVIDLQLAGFFAFAMCELESGAEPRLVATGRDNFDNPIVRVLEYSGAGLYGIAADYEAPAQPYGIACADIDADGDVDTVVSGYENAEVWHYDNDGAGELQDPAVLAVGTTPFGVALADFDVDGDEDLAVSNDATAEIQIFEREGGDWTLFDELDLFWGSVTTLTLRVADLDDDCDPDLLASQGGSSGATATLFGEEGLAFGPPTTLPGQANCGAPPGIGDVNEDGWLDTIAGIGGTVCGTLSTD